MKTTVNPFLYKPKGKFTKKEGIAKAGVFMIGPERKTLADVVNDHPDQLQNQYHNLIRDDRQLQIHINRLIDTMLLSHDVVTWELFFDSKYCARMRKIFDLTEMLKFKSFWGLIEIIRSSPNRKQEWEFAYCTLVAEIAKRRYSKTAEVAKPQLPQERIDKVREYVLENLECLAPRL